MCQQIVQFCNGSAKPLLLTGAALSALLALAVGYAACTNYALYSSIDLTVTRSRAPEYYLQLGAAVYLLAVSLLSGAAAYYEQKESIRALAVISAINCALALVALLMVSSGQEISKNFVPILEEARNKYNFTEKLPNDALVSSDLARGATKQNAVENFGGQVANSSKPTKRFADPQSMNDSQAPPRIEPVRDLSAHNATCLWDRLQERGCCGIDRANTTWSPGKFPKSCCAPSSVSDQNSEQFCKEVDQSHQQGCLKLIETAGNTLYLMIISIAVVSLYLAVVSGVSAYKTFHYSEASQSAY